MQVKQGIKQPQNISLNQRDNQYQSQNADGNRFDQPSDMLCGSIEPELYWTLIAGNSNVLRLLCKNDPDLIKKHLEAYSTAGYTILHMAIMYGSWKLVALILGVNKGNVLLSKRVKLTGATPLGLALDFLDWAIRDAPYKVKNYKEIIRRLSNNENHIFINVNLESPTLIEQLAQNIRRDPDLLKLQMVNDLLYKIVTKANCSSQYLI